MEQHDTPIERLGTKVGYQDEIGRLKEWLKLLKEHTHDGSILALIDMSLEGRRPLPNDYKPDSSEEKRGMNSLQGEVEVQKAKTNPRLLGEKQDD